MNGEIYEDVNGVRYEVILNAIDISSGAGASNMIVFRALPQGIREKYTIIYAMKSSEFFSEVFDHEKHVMVRKFRLVLK